MGAPQAPETCNGRHFRFFRTSRCRLGSALWREINILRTGAWPGAELNGAENLATARAHRVDACIWAGIRSRVEPIAAMDVMLKTRSSAWIKIYNAHVSSDSRITYN